MSTSSENDNDDFGLSNLTVTGTAGPITVFCYGSGPRSRKGGATATYACVFPDHGNHDEALPIEGDPRATNQRAILHAALAALRIADDIDPDAQRELEVFCNSTYLTNGMNIDIHRWVTNGWRTASRNAVANQVLWRELLAASDQRRVLWKHYENDVEPGDKAWAGDVHARAELAAKEAHTP